jgi:UDP-N-acetylmuramoyl-tripeptide--D-alanyl-D-alanine ligase
LSEVFSVADVVRWSDGRLLSGSGDGELHGAVIDSRQAGPGDLFFAIVGPNHDAHRFVPQVADAGAAAVVVQKDRFDDAAADGLAVIEVDDTTAALGAVAAGHRQRFSGPVVAITGSSGKTTTKEMCAAILRAAGPCLKTEGNLNNEFGLPLTLLRREADHRRAVVELGMNHRGEIARLAAIASPDVALVTNVGVAHIEFLGSQEEIANEKGDLYAALGQDGVAVVNLDDPFVSEQATRFGGRHLDYSCQREAEVCARDARFVDGGAFSFALSTPLGETRVSVSGLGATTVINATAAAAAAVAAGVAFEDVVAGLTSYRPPAGRMAPYPVAGSDGAHVIDDSYNANPISMRASLEALASLAEPGAGVAVLGDMGELGDSADAAHRDTGARVAELGIGQLVVLGEHAPRVVAGARDAGMDEARARIASDPEEACRMVRERLAPRDWVLVKGSRAMKLERVVEALRREKP